MELTRKHAALGIAAIILVFVTVPFLNLPVDIAEYGDIMLYNGRTGDPMDDTTILSIEDGDSLVAMLVEQDGNDNKPTDVDFSSMMQYYPDNTWVADGQDREVVNEYSYKWTFDLTDYEHETRVYHVRIYGYLGDDIIKGTSHTFQITYDSSESAYNDAVFIDVPVDATFYTGQSPSLVSWTFDYDNECEVELTLDGALVDTETYPANYQQETYEYSVDTSIAKVYTLILTVTPCVEANPEIVDTVVITVEESTTTTTTTTTTTDTEPPPLPIPEPEMMPYIAIAAVLIAIFILSRRRDSD